MALARTVLFACLAAPASPFLIREGNATRPSPESASQRAISNATKLSLDKAARSAAGSPQEPAAGGGAATEVARMRAKLSKVAAGLSAMLDAKEGLSTSQVGGTLSAFVDHVKAVVKETASMKDTARALQELREAQAGMSGLAAKMTSRQEELAKESSAQDQSLLLGVLMTRQHEPMEKQLAVLKSDSFSKLPVVVAVLAAHDTKTPLFQQVAAYLDKLGAGKPGAAAAPAVAAPPALPAKLKAGKDGKPDVGPIVNALTMQLHRMEESKRRTVSLHRDVMKQLEAAVEKERKKNVKAAKQVQLMERAEKRKYAKQIAMTDNDIKNLKKAIDSVQKGDLQGLAQSQAALATSMKAMQSQSGGFLYLIQLAHRAAELDCPYCAAQCIDKCHTAGRPYAMCLAQCAEAGK